MLRKGPRVDTRGPGAHTECMALELSHYPSLIHPLLSLERLPELGPGMPNAAALPILQMLSPNVLIPNARDADMVAACLSGLWLLHDCLDESHRISQDLDTSTGSFLHAIMHRREPDAWNSKYWWRRVGAHPVLGQLREETTAVGYEYTTPVAFVDDCEAERGKGNDREQLLRRVQRLEWDLLFAWCWEKAE